MNIIVDDLRGEAIARFLEEHLQDMRSVSPPESKHALDLDGLRQPGITFWTAMEQGAILGCAALMEITPDHAEVKSMRTARIHRGRGIGTILMRHLLAVASSRNYRQLSLETGAMEFFAPARALYRKFGFTECAPFSNYREDPNSVFMTLMLPSVKAQRHGAAI